MLLREDDHGVLAIAQPSHAWLSGQLARAWGNERFGRVEPFEEVCLAAEQHDAGWASREREPLFNPETGLPRSFIQMPLDVHLELWAEAPHLLLSQSRYAALLVSMHGWRLYERRDLTNMPADDAEAVRRFLAGQIALQGRLFGLLRDEEGGADRARAELLERNSKLIWTWDYLSLALCQNWAPVTAKGAPTAHGPVDIALTWETDSGVWHLDPWPFEAPSIVVRCEGRRLERRSDSERSLRRELDEARWELLQLELRPTRRS
jgi:hypothetical protein